MLSVLGAIVNVTRSQPSEGCTGVAAASLSETLAPTQVVFVDVCVPRRTPVALASPACEVAVCALKAIDAPVFVGNDVSQSKKRHSSFLPAVQLALKSRV